MMGGREGVGIETKYAGVCVFMCFYVRTEFGQKLQEGDPTSLAKRKQVIFAFKT